MKMFLIVLISLLTDRVLAVALCGPVIPMAPAPLTSPLERKKELRGMKNEITT